MYIDGKEWFLYIIIKKLQLISSIKNTCKKAIPGDFYEICETADIYLWKALKFGSTS